MILPAASNLLVALLLLLPSLSLPFPSATDLSESCLEHTHILYSDEKQRTRSELECWKQLVFFYPPPSSSTVVVVVAAGSKRRG